MHKIKIIFTLLILFSCANRSQNKNNGYNENLSKLIFSNYDLKNKFFHMFELNGKEKKIFKVVVSRRVQFVRISIFQIINKGDLDESPSSYFIFNSNTFFCYDGSELISNNRVEKHFIDKYKTRLTSDAINHSRVFQFDLDSGKNIKFNIPAINPWDLTERQVPIKLFNMHPSNSARLK